MKADYKNGQWDITLYKQEITHLRRARDTAKGLAGIGSDIGQDVVSGIDKLLERFGPNESQDVGEEEAAE